MFVVTVIFEVERDAAQDFLVRMRQQARDTLEREAGCSRFDVCVDPKRADRILLYEIYDDAAAFAAHLETEHFRAFDAEVSSITRMKKVESWSLT